MAEPTESEKLRAEAEKAAAGDQERAAKLQAAANATAAQEAADKVANDQREADRVAQTALDDARNAAEVQAHDAQEAVNTPA